jgi:hypothetical protein
LIEPTTTVADKVDALGLIDGLPAADTEAIAFGICDECATSDAPNACIPAAFAQ